MFAKTPDKGSLGFIKYTYVFNQEHDKNIASNFFNVEVDDSTSTANTDYVVLEKH